jgi:hypothetical protein
VGKSLMAPKYKPVPLKPMVKGCAAETDPYTQPPGTFPRGSNFLLNKRGALDVCDGSQLVHAFQGVIQAARGKILVMYYFSPTGVSSYYMALMRALDIPLGAPQNLTLVTAAGGTLAAANYFYRVTALDGVGGETLGSIEATIATGALGKNTLTWNVVPNAFGYNVYRSTVTNVETKLTGVNVPVAQVPAGTLTVSFVDDGTDSNTTVFAVTSARILSAPNFGGTFFYNANFIVPSTVGLFAGQIFTYIPGSNANFATTWVIGGIISATQFSASHGGPAIPGLIAGSTTNGGTFSAGTGVPAADTTQQIALFKMPVIAGSPAVLPVAYDNTNIVALFPASLTSFASVGGGGGGSGGGGGTGGGGTGGGGPRGGGNGRILE